MDVFERYLFEQEAEGRSPYTIEKARWAWKKFLQFTDRDITELSPADIKDFHAWLFAAGLHRNTVATHARVLHHFLRWCQGYGYISWTPPKAPSPEPPNRETLNPEQIGKFLQALSSGRNRLRNEAIGMLLLATGLRLREIAELRTEDLALSEGIVHIRAATSKTRRGRTVPLGSVARHALHSYLLFGRLSTDPTVFLGEDGRPLGRRGLHLVIQRAGKRAGLSRVFPHLLRHTFATQSLLQGSSAFHLKALLGHQSIRSTEVYVDMAEMQRAVAAGQHTALDSLAGRHGTNVLRRRA